MESYQLRDLGHGVGESRVVPVPVQVPALVRGVLRFEGLVGVELLLVSGLELGRKVWGWGCRVPLLGRGSGGIVVGKAR
jgi:hypothetical protein